MKEDTARIHLVLKLYLDLEVALLNLIHNHIELDVL